MSVGTRGQDRRRKLLREETRGASTSAPKTGRKSTALKRPYSERALAAAQPRITDFLPRRAFALMVCSLLLAFPPAVALLGYAWTVHAGGPRGGFPVQAFDLSRDHGLATWWTSLVLAFAALGCMLVWHLRRHKLDDYRGRYRLWVWSAASVSLASLDAGTGIVRDITSLGMRFAGRGDHHPQDAWVMAWVVLAFVPLLRMEIDLFRCRLASSLLFMGSCSYLAGAAMQLRYVAITDGFVRTFATFVALQLGHYLVLVSTLMYARYVYLVAQGEWRKARPKTARAKSKATTAAESKPEEEVSESAEQNPSLAKPSGGVSGSDRTDSHHATSLSRADEKRRRKELQRQQQQRRAA